MNDDTHARMNELRELTHDYLGTPTSHSMQIRNLLIRHLFNAAYPTPRGLNFPDKAILPTLGLAFVLLWAFPDLADLLQNIVRIAIVGFVIWLLLTYRRRRLIAHLREELQSSQFGDEIVRGQLEKLDARHHKLPTLIFSLIDQKPATFSNFEKERYVASVPPEQWREGIRITSNWKKQLREQLAPVKVS